MEPVDKTDVLPETPQQVAGSETLQEAATLARPGPFAGEQITVTVKSAQAEEFLGTHDLRQNFLQHTKFSIPDSVAMAALLGENRLVPPEGPNRLQHHVTYCFWQMIRFANLAQLGNEFRAAQFGLSLGRAQELLGSYGGKAAWWQTFEPLILAKDWAQIQVTVEHFLLLLCLDLPPVKFLNRK
jgi:hypothetical protein